jgi:hypothetical protein
MSLVASIEWSMVDHELASTAPPTLMLPNTASLDIVYN